MKSLILIYNDSVRVNIFRLLASRSLEFEILKTEAAAAFLNLVGAFPYI